jgi:hypothetical protein
VLGVPKEGPYPGVRPLSLTKPRNLFHKRDWTRADSARFGGLHAAVDRTGPGGYGWFDFGSGQRFHQDQHGQRRFTVSRDARRELIFRLLALQVGISGREAATSAT